MTAFSLPATQFIDESPAYYRHAPCDPWLLICTYPSAGDWHVAASILKRAGIFAQMCEDVADSEAYGLRVLAAYAEAARHLLSLPTRPKPLPRPAHAA